MNDSAPWQPGEGETTGGTVWIDLCGIEEVPANRGHLVLRDDRMMAVFRVDDGIRVLDDICPHAGGSLSAGPLADGCVICPWHGWAFHLKTGRCPDNPQIMVKTYPARVVEGRVRIKL